MTTTQQSTPINQNHDEIVSVQNRQPNNNSNRGGGSNGPGRGRRRRRKRRNRSNQASKDAVENVSQDGSEQGNASDRGKKHNTRKRNRNHKGRGRGNNAGGAAQRQAFSAFSRVRPQQSDDPSQHGSNMGRNRSHKNKNRFVLDPNLSDRTQVMIHELNRGKYECCICSEPIKVKQKTWSCSGSCKAPYHLSCIKQWSTSQNDSYSRWKCPLCYEDYSHIPEKYECWCKKQANPPFNPSIPAHSCGDRCGHKYENCPHTCQMMCHPGDHPPCQGVQNTSCACGKEKFKLKCSEATGNKISCGATCGKRLNCQIHTCPLKCGHDGDCPTCDKQLEQLCYCGKERVTKLCELSVRDFSHGDMRTFSCHHVCGKKYSTCDCRCEKTCHPGSCGSCPRLPENVKMCACGKTPLSELLDRPRESCQDPIPTCNLKHNVLLPCGQHKCKRKCHTDSCGDCMKMVPVSCRCEKKVVQLPCVFTYLDWEEAKKERPEFVETLTEKYLQPSKLSWPLVCDTPCKKRKSCLRHKCNNICCGGGDVHICDRICKRKLSCGKHKCDLHCHAGNCPPCTRVIREPMICRCGKTRLEPPQVCGTELPNCPHPCVIERECGHPSSDHLCHNEGSCPPCSKRVSKMCIGGHKIVHDVPCGLKDVCCSENCGKVLSCGNPEHTCKRGCHIGPCSTIPEGESCSFPCNTKIPCGHRCQRTCHPGTDCQTKGCTQQLKVFCDCRRRKLYLPCGEVCKLVKEKLGDDAPFDASDVPDVLDCDSECRRIARNEGLAEALGVDVLKCNLPAFGPELKEFGATQSGLEFIEYVERSLERFLDEKRRQHFIFRPMNRDLRVIVHTLTDFYRIKSESIDSGANRSVQVTKQRNSRPPKFLLSEVLRDAKKMEKLNLKLGEIEAQGQKHEEQTQRQTTKDRNWHSAGVEVFGEEEEVEQAEEDVDETWEKQRDVQLEKDMQENDSGIESSNRWKQLAQQAE